MTSIAEIAISIRSLHAITSGGRMRVLRCLTARRMTSAEVSTALRMRKSSAHKHLLRLARAGFVRRHDDGDRVWVYYSLTSAGRHLAESERPRLVLLFVAWLLATLGAFGYVALQAKRRFFTEPTGSWGMDDLSPTGVGPFFSGAVLVAVLIGVLGCTGLFAIGRRLTAAARASSADVPA